MVSIYKCDYCGEDIQQKTSISPIEDSTIGPVRIDTVDLCGACQQHIFDMIKSQIDERRKIREKN